MFILISLDLSVGIAVVLTVALDPAVYDNVDPNTPKSDDVHSSYATATMVLLIIQKLLYQIIILQQVFEWTMYFVFIRFQTAYDVNQLIGLKLKYHQLERWLKWLYILVCLPVFLGM